MAKRTRDAGTKERLGTRPPGSKVTGTWVSLPGRRVAHAVEGGPVYLDGVPGPPGEQTRHVSFSEDGRHHAYYLWRGEKYVMVIDGRERGELVSVGPTPVWNGEHVAYAGRRGKGWWIFVDGDPRFGPFVNYRHSWGGDLLSELVWTRRGLAYAVTDGKDMRFELEGNPVAGEHFEFVHDFVVGADDATYAYRGSRKEIRGLVFNGITIGPFDRCDRPKFAHDGRLWFVTHGADNMTGRTFGACVYVDGSLAEKHPRIDQLALAQSASKHALVVDDTAYRDHHRFIVHGTRRTKMCSDIFGLSITPDGAHVSAVAGDGDEDYILLDDAVLAIDAYIAPWDSVLSDDGRHVAFLANENGFGKPGSRVSVDGEVESEPIDTLASEIIFAPDGKSVSFIAEQGRTTSLFTLPTKA